MTFQYPKRLAYLTFGAAMVMQLAPLADSKIYLMQNIGWLALELFIFVLFLVGIFFYRFSCTIDDDSILVTGFRCTQYSVSRITAINVMIGKGARHAVVTFKDGRVLNFPNYIDNFKSLVELLRAKTGLEKPRWEE